MSTPLSLKRALGHLNLKAKKRAEGDIPEATRQRRREAQLAHVSGEPNTEAEDSQPRKTRAQRKDEKKKEKELSEGKGKGKGKNDAYGVASKSLGDEGGDVTPQPPEHNEANSDPKPRLNTFKPLPAIDHNPENVWEPNGASLATGTGTDKSKGNGNGSESWFDDATGHGQLVKRGTETIIGDVSPANAPPVPIHREGVGGEEVKPEESASQVTEDVGEEEPIPIIDRIRDQLQNLRTEKPSIKFGTVLSDPFTLLDVEKDLHIIAREYRSTHVMLHDLVASHKMLDDLHDDMKAQHKEALDEKARLLSRTEREKEGIKQEKERIERAKDKQIYILEGQIVALNEVDNKKEQQHHARIEQIERKHTLVVDKLKGDRRLAKSVHDTAMERLRQQHSAAMEQKDAVFASNLVEKIDPLQKQISELQAVLNTKDRDHESDIETWQHALREEQGRSTRKLEKEKSRAAQELFQEKERAALEVQTLQQGFEAQMVGLQRQMNSDRNHSALQVSKEKQRADQEITAAQQSFATQLGDLKRQLDSEKNLAAQQVSKQKERADLEIQTAKQGFTARLEEEQRLLDETIRGRTREIEKARERFELENAKTISFYEAQKTKLEQQMQTDRQIHHDQIMEIQKQLQEEVAGRSKAISEIKSQLGVKHDKEKKAMKESLQDLKEALVARDHFKAMSDDELAYRFEEIGSEVSEFAQVVWDKRLESNWPFTDQQFQACENKRRMKEQVLQNTVWVILYENIFCTPFRVLGEEGRRLEIEWVQMHDPAQYKKSTGAVPPRATKDSEKWRYETIQEYVEATERGREGDENYDVKSGFESTLQKIADDISRELGKVAPVSESEQERLIEVVHKAANLWLEVGQQRCRMFLSMSRSSEAPKRSARSSLSRDGTLNLVVMPELKRLGNAQGEELNRVVVVASCQGRFSRFPT